MWLERVGLAIPLGLLSYKAGQGEKDLSEKKGFLKVNWHKPKKTPSGGDLTLLMKQRIRQLPAFHRKVLALRYHEGLRLREIAEITGVCRSLVYQVHREALWLVSLELPKRHQAA